MAKKDNQSDTHPATAYLFDSLQSLGVDVQLAERGRTEESFTFGRGRSQTAYPFPYWARVPWPSRIPLGFQSVSGYGQSVGLIDIQDGPIHWVNVREYSGLEDVYYSVEYGVPVSGMPREFAHVHLKLIRHRTIPLLGRIKRVDWRGKDFGLGIANRLNNDSSLADAVMAVADLETTNTILDIDADPAHEFWLLTARPGRPSRQLWECYQLIARHLLAMPMQDHASEQLESPKL